MRERWTFGGVIGAATIRVVMVAVLALVSLVCYADVTETAKAVF